MDSIDSNPLQPPAIPPSGTTRLNPKWLIKHLLIGVACLTMFIWGYIDAAVVYPSRGARAAEFLEFQYLKELQSSGTLSNDRAGIADPIAEQGRLSKKEGDEGKFSPADQLRKKWLDQLAFIKRLVPANTVYPRSDFRVDESKPVAVPSASERLAMLKEKYETGEAAKKSKPEELAFYDIPVQWFITALGGLGALWFGWGILRAKKKSYSWDAPTMKLTLPDGGALTPSDIVEFDKTKWDKFYITLRTRPDHPVYAGKGVDLDLLTYAPLEEWVLAMEAASGKGQAPKP